MRAGKSLHIILYLALSGLVYNGCVEQFEPETQAFENALVVDALLTDEEKKHRVLLSRTRRFENEDSIMVTDAKVSILDDFDNRYSLSEVNPGIYESLIQFKAERTRKYRLQIETPDGRMYSSDAVALPEQAAIHGLYADKTFNSNGEVGISIFVDSENTATNANFFRYEYEETFTIVPPFYNSLEFEVVDDIFFGDGDGYEIILVPRDKEARRCYDTHYSTSIKLADTRRSTNGRFSKLKIRFIDSHNYIISDRYSILAKQFAMTEDAYIYYLNLEDFNSSENIFSDTQPGFLEGNIHSKDFKENVLGYFEVASVTEKRIFFDYVDFFPEVSQPPYAINCEPVGSPPLYEVWPHFDPVTFLPNSANADSPLLQAIQANLITYFDTNEDFEFVITNAEPEELAPYYTKSKACGDCRVLGSTIRPNFWED